MARITSLYRYPVKGFSPEPLETVTLAAGETFPWDRAFAIENGRSGFDPDHPKYLQKIFFLMLMKNERMAEFATKFNDLDGSFTVSRDGEEKICVSLFDEPGRRALEVWISSTFKDDLRGPPRLLFAKGHSFSDKPAKVLHLINLESIRALEAEIGQPVNPIRFRPNIIIDGVPAFEEFAWTESRIKLPDLVLNGESRTQRCAATTVDPATAVRDLMIPRILMKRFGHADFGIYLTVANSGTLALGDDLIVEERSDAALPI